MLLGYEKMWDAKKKWIECAREYVGKCGTLALSQNESSAIFPSLTLNNGDGTSCRVTFDKVRMSDNNKLEFEVEDSDGYIYGQGEWMSEPDFPNNEWTLLVPTISWPD